MYTALFLIVVTILVVLSTASHTRKSNAKRRTDIILALLTSIRKNRLICKGASITKARGGKYRIKESAVGLENEDLTIEYFPGRTDNPEKLTFEPNGETVAVTRLDGKILWEKTPIEPWTDEFRMLKEVFEIVKRATDE